jgi:predicted 3-demethylubiquinone-9 3-methyltransferase (glyoxalase superfamily)
MQKFTTFLMFVGEQCGKAEEAINLYVSLFKSSSIIAIDRYGEGEEEREGTVKRAAFSLNGQTFMAIDSAREHDFTFTPAISLFVQCETEEEVNSVFERLSEGGKILMELGNYGFSEMFGWVQDAYGVTWQLNLEGS